MYHLSNNSTGLAIRPYKLPSQQQQGTLTSPTSSNEPTARLTESCFDDPIYSSGYAPPLPPLSSSMATPPECRVSRTNRASFKKSSSLQRRLSKTNLSKRKSESTDDLLADNGVDDYDHLESTTPPTSQPHPPSLPLNSLTSKVKGGGSEESVVVYANDSCDGVIEGGSGGVVEGEGL